jgi:hypothetical protein
MEVGCLVRAHFLTVHILAGVIRVAQSTWVSVLFQKLTSHRTEDWEDQDTIMQQLRVEVDYSMDTQDLLYTAALVKA